MSSLFDVTSLGTEKSGTAIGMMIGFIAIAVPLIQFLLRLSTEKKDRRFEIFHQLIKEFSGQEKIMIDRQIAIAFELRNYPEYYDVTIRILEGLRSGWVEDNSNARLIHEIDLTLDHIRWRRRNFLARLLFKRR